MADTAVLDTVAEDLEAPDDTVATLGNSNGDETAAETADAGDDGEDLAPGQRDGDV